MIHYRTCSLCEANCGLEVRREGQEILSIRGNAQDVFSQGYMCPKATALEHLHNDPDRLRQPMRREGSEWVPVSWSDAISEAAQRIHKVQAEHGPDAVALYLGNPNVHNYSNILAMTFFREALGSRHQFAATSVDQLPHMFAAYSMFGHQLLLPVPDIDHTDLMIVVGGNPVVSNGSLMTAPNMRGRLRGVQERGGKVVVIDPRRTETAELADEHLWVRPGTDALLFLSMLHVLFAEALIQDGKWKQYSEGLQAVKDAAASFSPERVSTSVGVTVDDIVRLTRLFASTPKAALYGRMGVCTQAYGGLNAWLIYVLNLVTGHLDQRGGMMFTHPAADLLAVASMLKQTGQFNTQRSRVRGLPEFSGEFPVSILSEEMETPGPGQIRALITVAGNPVLSTPNGQRLARNLENLDCYIALDPFVTASTRHAHFILPPPSPLERDHYALVFHALAVRNTAKYDEALFVPPASTPHDWETLLALGQKLNQKRRGLKARWQSLKLRLLRRFGMRRILSTLLFFGRYGPLRNWKKRLTLRKLKAHPEGIDLGPLQPCLPERLFTSNKKVQLAPDALVEDVCRLERALQEGALEAGSTLLLVGRRHLRSNNSWLHNAPKMVSGKPRCTLLMHPTDAQARDLRDGQRVAVSSRVGEVEVTLCISDEMMPGVVSLPHGWGHRDKGAVLRVANTTEGASVNDLTDDQWVDVLTGNAGLNGVKVEVRTLGSSSAQPEAE